MNLFLSIVSSFSPTKFSNNYSGVVFTKRKLLQTWKKRILSLDIEKNSINLISFKSQKVRHTMMLSKTIVEAFDKPKSGKYCFNLKSWEHN